MSKKSSNYTLSKKYWTRLVVIASLVSMSTTANALSLASFVGPSILGSGSGLTGSYGVRSNITTQDNNQLRATIKNTAKQSNMAKFETYLVNSLGNTNSQGVFVDTMNVCSMTGQNSASQGEDVGAAYAKMNSNIIMHNMDEWDRGHVIKSNTQALQMLSETPPSTMNADNIFGKKGGYNGVTAKDYSPENVNKTIAVMTDPFPPAKLPSNAESTPMGKKYQAMSHLASAQVELPQAVFADIVSLNAPLLPLGNWAAKALVQIAEGMGAPSNGQPTTQPSPAVAAAVKSDIADSKATAVTQSQVSPVASATSATASTQSNGACNPNNWQANIMPSPQKQHILNCIQMASADTGVPATWIAANIGHESNGNPNTKYTTLGNGYTAYGLGQVNNPTANTLYQQYGHETFKGFGPLPYNTSHHLCMNVLQTSLTIKSKMATLYRMSHGKYGGNNYSNANFGREQIFYYGNDGIAEDQVAAGVNPVKADNGMDKSYLTGQRGVENFLTCPGKEGTMSGGNINSGSDNQNMSGFEVIAPYTGGSLIPINEFLYIQVMQRISNPAWWDGVQTSNSDGYLKKQIAELQAIMSDINYYKLKMHEDVAALKAQKASLEAQKVYDSVANALRNRSVSEAVNASK